MTYKELRLLFWHRQPVSWIVLLWHSAETAISCCDGWKHHKCAQLPSISKCTFSKTALQIGSTERLIVVPTWLTKYYQYLTICWHLLPYILSYYTIFSHIPVYSPCQKHLAEALSKAELGTPAVSDLFAPQAPQCVLRCREMKLQMIQHEYDPAENAIYIGIYIITYIYMYMHNYTCVYIYVCVWNVMIIMIYIYDYIW